SACRFTSACANFLRAVLVRTAAAKVAPVLRCKEERFRAFLGVPIHFSVRQLPAGRAGPYSSGESCASTTM
ncbi:hypothetical protein L1K75_23550, partial [Salmonella enterica subsp. enterica serovar Anatum]|nr:hypothetical protein [Salmonella enterica subsp. enterica serovar Anatum]